MWTMLWLSYVMDYFMFMLWFYEDYAICYGLEHELMLTIAEMKEAQGAHGILPLL